MAEIMKGGNNPDSGEDRKGGLFGAFNNLSNIINKSTAPDNNRISNKITDEINNRMNQNKKSSGYSSPGSVYKDVFSTNIVKKDILPLISDFYGSEGLRDIVHKKAEVDSVMSHMPILDTAISLSRINILKADNIEKNFLKITSERINETEKLAEIEKNAKHLVSKYKLVEKFTSMYDDVSKYGETFIHIIPNGDLFTTKEGRLTTLLETTSMNVTEDHYKGEKKPRDLVNRTNDIKLIFNEYDRTLEGRAVQSIMESPLYESVQRMNDSVLNESSKKNSKTSNLHGSVIRELKQENILPVYIDDTCLGYFYIEGNNSKDMYSTSLLQTMQRRKTNAMLSSDIKNKNDKIARVMAKELGKKISHKFLKDNLDISGDIYNIVKFLDMEELKSVHVTYIPPNHCEHIWFRLNKTTKRGIGDVEEKALKAAKAYITLDLCYLYSSLVASHDTRVYYVQTDTNGNLSPSAAVNKTLHELKRSNRSLDNLLDIGRISDTMKGIFHSYIVPVNSDNTPAIQPDTYPGQEVNINLDYLDSLEIKAVEALGGAPYEYVKSSFETDFSRRLTQDHGKFIQFCEERQTKLGLHFTRIMNELYKNEYGEDVSLIVTLPQPLSYKEQTNTALLNTVIERVNILSELYVPKDDATPDDEKVRMFRQKFVELVLSDYLDTDNISKTMQELGLDVVENKINKAINDMDNQEE